MSDNALSQSHFGSGDNVAKNKVVFETYISFINKSVPDDLQTPIKEILREITNRSFSKARDSINFLSGINNLNEEVKEILKLLLVKCDVSEELNGSSDIGLLQEIFSTSKNEMIKDLALSIIFIIETIKHGKEIAEKRYNALSSIGPFSRAAAFHLFLEREELLTVFKDQIFSLTEEELIGLINGLFREECYDEALQTAESLNRSFNNYNSKVVLLFAQHFYFHMTFKDSDYFTLKQYQKNNLINLIDETVRVFKLDENTDVRLFNIIIPSLMYVKKSHKELERICLENIEHVNNFSEGFCDDLKLKNNQKDFSVNHPINIITKARSNHCFQDEFLSGIIQKKKVSYNELRMARELMPFDEFEEWVTSGVSIDGNFTSLDNKLNQIFISLSVKDKETIKGVVKEISKENIRDLQDTDSEFLTMLTDSMQRIDLIHESCELMLLYMHNVDDVWCSPLVEKFGLLLYNSARYKDLLQFSERVNEQDKSLAFDNLVIFTQLFFNSAEEAYKLIKNYKHENNLEFIRLKLLTFIKLDKKDCIKQEVNNFDYSLFDSTSVVARSIVALLIECNEMASFEKIVINWFIESPVKNYRYISDACLSLILKENKVNFSPSYDVQGLSHGVQYKDGGKTLTKLISSGGQFENPYILKPESLLSSSLLKAKAGDEIDIGYKRITIDEVMPPYVAIHRLAIQIRDEFNDGSDPFQSFNTSNDPEELMQQLKRSLSLRNSNFDGLQSIISNDTAPLSFRMHLLDKNDPVKAALSLLLNKKSFMKGFEDFGENLTEDLCTDIITVIYSCLTSFSKFFIEQKVRLYLLQEDIDAIYTWVRRIDTDKYMVLSETESGGLFINTAETIRQHYSFFLNNLKEICTILRPLNIVLDNYSQEVMSLSESFGPNYAKQIYAYKNCSYPYLSVDTQNAFLVKSLVPVTLANSRKIFNKAWSLVPFIEREKGLTLHTHGAMPYPLMIQDFVALSYSIFDKDGFHLSSLIKKYTGNFNKNIKVHHFMALLIAQYVDKSLLEWQVDQLTYTINPFGPRVDRVFNVACNAIISLDAPEDRETKLAKLFVLLVFYDKYIEGFIDLVNNLAYQFCVGHFISIPQVKKNMNDIFHGNIKI